MPTAIARRTLCALALLPLLGATSNSLRAQTPTASERSLSLEDAIARALTRGPAAKSAGLDRDAARWRDRSFNARLLPQLSLSGDVPVYSRAIIPVVQPDGTTRFVPNQQRSSALAMTARQRLPFTGGDLFVSTGVSNVNILGTQQTNLWRGTPFQVGVSQQLFRPRGLIWDAREQDLRTDVAERAYL